MSQQPPTSQAARAPGTALSAHLEADVSEQAEVVLSIATARVPSADADSSGDGDGGDETLTITSDGEAVPYQVVVAQHGTRLHRLPKVPPGRLVVDYRAHFTDQPTAVDDDPSESTVDHIVYVRPSRYCESDTLGAVAGAEFRGLAGKDLLDAVTSWVGQRLAYVSGSSRHTDGAVDTYLARQGVCRDFAHLVVALLRARGVPARFASVYAPGLTPMDFHAVAEAQLDGGWFLVDATGLAPRQSMVRIATGRDAADTAFMTTHTGRLRLASVKVTATATPDLPVDDVTQLVRLP